MQIPELIREAKQGSAAAQKCLFDQLSDHMFTICRRYVKNREDAEELLLNGFFKVFRNLPSFVYETDAAFVAWMKRIMINECLMFLRKKNVLTIIGETAAEELMLEEDMLDRLSAVEIFELIVQLPAGYRTVFNLQVIEGYSHKEIATMMNISEGTSKSQLNKARSLLQKMLLQKDNYYNKQKSQ